MRTQRQSFKLCIRHFQTCRIDGRVQVSLATKTGLSAGSRNVIENRLVTFERSASPVAAYQIEHSMLNRVPLGSTRRIMGHGDRQATFVSQSLKPYFPQPATTAIAAATITFNQQMLLIGIDTLAYLQPPLSDRCYSKPCCVMRRSHDHKSLSASNIINPVRDCFARSHLRKVVEVDSTRTLAPFTTRLLEFANQFDFLRIHTDNRKFSS